MPEEVGKRESDWTDGESVSSIDEPDIEYDIDIEAASIKSRESSVPSNLNFLTNQNELKRKFGTF